MSVHGEFGRAVERVIACLEMIDRPEARAWRETVEAARISNQPDLSTAARTALDAVDTVLRDPACPIDSDLLQEATEHLRAHCRAILGLRDPESAPQRQ